MKTLPRKQRSAYTLIELMVVIAIIVVLAACILSALLASRAKGYEAKDINHLKQLGVAGALYNETYGMFPDSTAPLVNLKLVPASMVASALDPNREGMANLVVRDELSTPFFRPENLTKYKSSYVGPREFCMSEIRMNAGVRNTPYGGWLVEISTGKNPDPRLPSSPLRLVGKYKRLLYDTSVVLRDFKSGIGDMDGKPAPFRSAEQMFTDDPSAFESR